MRMKASAYKQYGDAAILSLVLESLPQVGAWDNFGQLYKKLWDKSQEVLCGAAACCRGFNFLTAAWSS